MGQHQPKRLQQTMPSAAKPTREPAKAAANNAKARPPLAKKAAADDAKSAAKPTQEPASALLRFRRFYWRKPPVAPAEACDSQGVRAGLGQG